MLNLKPYAVIIVHEDEPDPDGVPTEIVEYTWTHKGGEKLRDQIWKDLPKGKWMLVLAHGWMWWWTINCGTVYRYEGFDEENSRFIRTPIRWWRRERLWRALWKLIKKVFARHSSNA